MPMTVAPTSASARTNCRWVGGKAGSTKTMFTFGMLPAVLTGNFPIVVVAAFVAPFLLEATARFVATAAEVPGVQLGIVTTEPVENLPLRLKSALAAHWRVDDALDPGQIAGAVRGLANQIGPVERLIGALEQLQVPLAQVREGLGIAGMDENTARNVRDKARMKEVLRA